MKASVLLAAVAFTVAAHAQNVPLEIPKTHGGFFAFAFSPDGARVASGTGAVTMTSNGKSSTDGAEVIVWDAKTGKIQKIFGKHPASVRWLSYSKDGTILASASDDGTVKLWDAKTGAARHTLKLPGPLGKSSNGSARLCALSADGRTFAGVGTKLGKVGTREVRVGDTLIVYDTASGQPRWQLVDSHAAALTFTPDGGLAAFAVKVEWKETPTGAQGAHTGARFVAWDATGKERWSTEAKGGSPNTLVFVPGRGLIAWASRQFTVLDPATGAKSKEIKVAGKGFLQGLTVTADGGQAASSRFMSDGIEWIDLAKGQVTGMQEFPSDRFSEAAFSPDLQRAVGVMKFTPQIVTLAPTAP